MNPAKRRNGFEFFGFDFMIDEDFRLWLIEVNTNPYIGLHNEKMNDVLPQMFKGLFKITLDPIFEPSTLIDKLTEGTNWEILVSRHRSINKRRGIDESLYPIKELSTRRELPKKFYKLKNGRDYRSNWTERKRKIIH